MAFELPPLPYDYSALEPTIDAATMKLHHDMHHAAYVKNLNAALEKHPNLQSKSAEDLIRDLNALPEDIRGAVRNNGGGHVLGILGLKIRMLLESGIQVLYVSRMMHVMVQLHGRGVDGRFKSRVVVG